MWFVSIFFHILTGMFLVGIAGSAVVVVLSFFDDFTQLFRNETGSEDLTGSTGPGHSGPANNPSAGMGRVAGHPATGAVPQA
ncbi:MAG TPA: hypothetical protein VMV57_02460 [Terracidiphilus sp.]|nr:hypothetical protein [Terracidiphilus sp.]